MNGDRHKRTGHEKTKKEVEKALWYDNLQSQMLPRTKMKERWLEPILD